MGFDLLSDACFESVKHTPLARIDSMINWTKVMVIVEEAVPNRGTASTGRPAYSREQLARLAVLKLLHVCSAADACQALRCRLDWRCFCRFDLLADLPEVSTLNRFIRTLSKEMEDADQLLFGKTGQLYDVVLQSVLSKGYRLRTANGGALTYPRLRKHGSAAGAAQDVRSRRRAGEIQAGV